MQHSRKQMERNLQPSLPDKMALGRSETTVIMGEKPAKMPGTGNQGSMLRHWTDRGALGLEERMWRRVVQKVIGEESGRHPSH